MRDLFTGRKQAFLQRHLRQITLMCGSAVRCVVGRAEDVLAMHVGGDVTDWCLHMFDCVRLVFTQDIKRIQDPAP